MPQQQIDHRDFGFVPHWVDYRVENEVPRSVVAVVVAAAVAVELYVPFVVVVDPAVVFVVGAVDIVVVAAGVVAESDTCFDRTHYVEEVGTMARTSSRGPSWRSLACARQ